MGWPVVFSPRCREDLRKIVDYIAVGDAPAAERFGFALIAQAEALADAPNIGMRMPERPGTRFFPCGSYLIIYRADTARKTVPFLAQCTRSTTAKMIPRNQDCFRFQ